MGVHMEHSPKGTHYLFGGKKSNSDFNQTANSLPWPAHRNINFN
jgi:hypothetical protein